MRVTAGMIVGMIDANHSIEQILHLYPYLEVEGIVQALHSRRERSNSSNSAHRTYAFRRTSEKLSRIQGAKDS
jgi:uncharacterized protein (DUF433 family)